MTGAFIDMNPDEVLSSTKTGISITFYAPNPVNGLYPEADTMITANINTDTPR